MAEIKVELNSGNQEPIVINRSRLTQLSSLSQSTSSPDSIQYGTIANSGSIEMTDYNEDIKALIKDGTLNPSDVDVSLYVNNNLVQKHLSTDSNYDSADKTFNISLSNKVKDMETLKYGGYVYQDTAISVFDLLKDVLSSFLGQTLSDANLETMLSAYMIHPTEGTKVHIYEYAKEINIKYPSIEYGRTYRDVIDELCTILQCYMYVDDNDDLVFESARPLLASPDTENAIRITKDKMYSPLKDAVILKNKYDGVEISEQNVGPEVDIATNIDTWNSNSQGSVYTSTTADSEGSGAGTTAMYYAYQKVTYWQGTVIVPKKKDSNLTTIDNLLSGTDASGNPNIRHTINGKYKTGTVVRTGEKQYQPTYTNEASWSGTIATFSTFDYNPWTYPYSVSTSLNDETNLKTLTITETQDGTGWTFTFNIAVGMERYATGTVSSSEVSGDAEYYYPEQLEVSVYGNKTTIKFEDSSASSTGIDSAKTIASVQTGKLIQNVTQVGSTQAGYYEDGVKITDVIKSTILDDYENGIADARVTVCCDDFYNASGTKVVDWSQGQTLQVCQVVFFTDDKYSNGKQRYWRITGRRFYWEGAPYCDLELQEVVNYLLAGLYDEDWNLVKDWQQLLNDGDIVVENNKITNHPILQGNLIIQNGITGISTNFGNYWVGNEYRNELTNITLPKSLTSLDDYALYNISTISDITIPSDAQITLGKECFSRCYSVKTIHLFSNNLTVESLSNQPFYITGDAWTGCSLILSQDITSIPDGLFARCRIADVNFATIPALSQIGELSFANTYIETLDLPQNITTIKNRAFDSCQKLKEINFSAANMYDCEFNNKIFYKAGQQESGITVNIGSNVEQIPAYLFNPSNSTSYSPNITSVLFDNDSECANIGSFAFAYVSSLTSVIIPNSVTEIGWDAFNYCSGLRNVQIGSGILMIRPRAFANCSNLSDITILAQTPPELPFTNAIPSNVQNIYIPYGTLSSYQNATNWSSFSNKFVELSE